MRLADIGFYHPDTPQILLHHIVQLIIRLKYALKNRMRVGHNKIEAQGQNGNNSYKCQCNHSVNFQHHEEGET
ncbi:hypothetical protein SDC9_139857 [bioreactor metagenome]|uniref:Uncharacterized protein n=1 Tax=bioreactor metagenome TaxID=1076179 RepID=A0A645DTT1_9ZZZZ